MYGCYHHSLGWGHLTLRWGVLLLTVWASDICFAQVGRYQPATPTVSPYLNLTRRRTGAFPNYYAYVKPILRQREINRRDQALRQQQAGSLRRLQNDVQLGLQPTAATGISGKFMFQGSRSTYLDTLYYYPGRPIRVGR